MLIGSSGHDAFFPLPMQGCLRRRWVSIFERAVHLRLTLRHYASLGPDPIVLLACRTPQESRLSLVFVTPSRRQTVALHAFSSSRGTVLTVGVLHRALQYVEDWTSWEDFLGILLGFEEVGKPFMGSKHLSRMALVSLRSSSR